ncbi:MAG TPA: cupin domain-containing protein [Gammaproteobacteria bacterium]
MARIVKLKDAEDLGLPGRLSRQIFPANDLDAPLTLRYVEIPVQAESETRRTPHFHRATEDCIPVLRGSGEFETDAGVERIGAGDTILVPRGEPHVTHNIGNETLRLLCYFPTGKLASHG